MNNLPRLITLVFTVSFFVLAPATGNGQNVELGIPLGHRQPLGGMYLLPSGNLITTSSQDNVLYYWSLAQRRLLKRLFVYPGFNIDMVTADGLLVMWAHHPEDSTMELKIYNPATRKGRIAFVDGVTEEESGAFNISRDGKYYVRDGKLLPLFPEEDPIIELAFAGVAFNPLGDLIYNASPDPASPVDYSYPDLKEVPYDNNLVGGDENERFFEINNGAYLYQDFPQEGATKKETRLWQSGKGELMARILLNQGEEIEMYNKDVHSLLISSISQENGGSEKLRRLDLKTGTYAAEYVLPDREQPQTGFPSRSGFSSDGKLVLRSGVSGAIYLFDAMTGKLVDSLISRVKIIEDLELAQDGAGLLITTSEPGQAPSLVSWQWFGENNLDFQQPAESNQGFRSRFMDDANAAAILATINDEADKVAAEKTLAGWSRQEAPPNYRVNFLEYEDNSDPTICKFELIDAEGRAKVITHQIKEPLAYGEPSTWTISADNFLAIGTKGGYVLLFDFAGNLKASQQVHDGAVNSLVFTRDSDRVLSGGEDGSVHLLKSTDLSEIADLFLLGEDNWVVTDTENRFDASPAAMEYLYYIVTDEQDKKEIIAFTQMKENFYDPGLLQKLLGYSKVPARSVKGLNEAALYPNVTLSLNEKQLTVTLEPRSGGIGRVSLFVNSKELAADVNPNRVTSFSIDLKDYERYFLFDNTLTIYAENADGSLRSSAANVPYVYPQGAKARGAGSGGAGASLSREQFLNAKLYVICVGTSDYAETGGKSMDLTFPDADAEVMSKALKNIGCELFCTNGEVESVCLTTSDQSKRKLAAANIDWSYASKDNIQQAFAEVSKKAKVQDVVIVYFSGHGKTYRSNNKDQFHYLTHEVSLENVGNETATRNAVISSEELTSWMKTIPSYKQVLILDACNSGKIIEDASLGTKELNGSQVRALTRMSDRTGLYMITGSAADMVSFEAGKYGQGLLTYALLKGMQSELVLQKDEGDTYFVGVTELFEYAKNEVADMARNINGVQRPQLNYPLRAGSFPVGIYDANTTVIELSDEKHTFVRSSFQNNDSFWDDLDLASGLEALFREEMRQGKESLLVYMDIKNAANAYRVGGRYSQNEDGTITLNANLLQAGQQPISLMEERPGAAPKPISGRSVEMVVRKLERLIYQALEGQQ